MSRILPPLIRHYSTYEYTKMIEKRTIELNEGKSKAEIDMVKTPVTSSYLIARHELAQHKIRHDIHHPWFDNHQQQ